MKPFNLIACAAAALALTGCDLVISKHPVGRPLALEESEWAGTWMHGDGPLIVRVVDAEKGLLEVAWIEEKDDELVLESLRVHLGRFGEWTFASFANVEDVPDYLWSRLERDGERIFLWWPRPEEFRRLVEADLLPGTVEDNDVLLGALTDAHLEIVVSEERGVLFDWAEPMTLRRLRRP